MTTNEVGKLYLPWLIGSTDEYDRSRQPTKFLDSSPMLDGERITETQIGRVLQRAEALGLVRGTRSMGSTLPLDVRILPPGRQCVEDYAGDMNEFERSLRGTSSTTQTMNVHQRDGGNVSGFNFGDTAQSTRIEVLAAPERIQAGADAAEELLRLYPQVQNRSEIESAVEAARQAAVDGDDEERASAASRLVTAITTMAGVSTLARFVIDWLGGPGALG
ncbi:hypothetical protein H7X46_11430 [Pseudonocardia sp. C8]|uniref:hypothetical protein n=1 Tax=Pseudonocardia sp. C8 TaxID=2762759 RepID=UPI0016430DEA|nr:hypothetical protein [Pseudonocardia sp. C8]MBC3191672.1 hypothetical protein [Pseudonocardia sp. C8]